MKTEILDQVEQVSSVIEEVGLLKFINRVRQHHDEPKFWHYSATVGDNYLEHDGRPFHSKASGVSFFMKERAILKVMMEAIERYNNFAFFKRDVGRVGSYSDIEEIAVDPREFIFFSDDQMNRRKYEKFQIDSDSIFRWTKIRLWGSKEIYYVPCQAVYLSYQPINEEPTIYPSISTGTAGHFSFDNAVLNGAYEVLERDAFMIYYLNKLKPKRYNLTSFANKEIEVFLEIADRYDLQILSLDITTDVNVPVVASVVIDRSNLSKAVSVGLKSHFNVEKAIIGSINEAFHTRTWIRESYIENSQTITKSELLENSSIKNRGIFWYPTQSISKLDFLINNLESVEIVDRSRELSVRDQLSGMEKRLMEKGYMLYYKDMTSRHFENMPVCVVKVIIPGMQPLYLNEKYPLKGGIRMQTVPTLLGYNDKRELNTWPHPFL